VQTTADHIHSWLYAYSQPTDTDGLTGLRRVAQLLAVGTGRDRHQRVDRRPSRWLYG